MTPVGGSECDSLLLSFAFCIFLRSRKTACKECNRFSTNVVLDFKLVKSIFISARDFFQNCHRRSSAMRPHARVDVIEALRSETSMSEFNL